MWHNHIHASALNNRCPLTTTCIRYYGFGADFVSKLHIQNNMLKSYIFMKIANKIAKSWGFINFKVNDIGFSSIVQKCDFLRLVFSRLGFSPGFISFTWAKIIIKGWCHTHHCTFKRIEIVPRFPFDPVFYKVAIHVPFFKHSVAPVQIGLVAWIVPVKWIE